MPVWPFTLSGRLPIDALVGRYPTNKLIGRGSLLERPKAFISVTYVLKIVCGISPSFPGLSPSGGQVTHALLSRLPLPFLAEAKRFARLACIKRAASVHPEPRSNSLIEITLLPSTIQLLKCQTRPLRNRSNASILAALGSVNPFCA